MNPPRSPQGKTLPFQAAQDSERTASPRAAAEQDVQTVLVVDDQHVVLELVDAFLETTDYRVYLAGSGRQALDICARIGGGVDLLLTDVRMPGMNGPELYERLVELHPGIKVLFMSGFQAAEAARYGIPSGAPLLVKPFKPEKLLERMGAVLDGLLLFPDGAAARA